MADEILTLLREGRERSVISEAVFEELLRDRHEFWLRPAQFVLIIPFALDILLRSLLEPSFLWSTDVAAPSVGVLAGTLVKIAPALTLIVVGFGIAWTFYSIAARRRRAETRIALIRAELIDRFLTTSSSKV
jgi:hypothetical protein